nr:hypothetical protein [Clostridium botulinum]
MQYKCKKCGKFCNIGLNKYFKVLLSRKVIFMCETCEGIDRWKNDAVLYYENDFPLSESFTLESYDPRFYEWINRNIISSNKYCEIKMKCGTVYKCFVGALKGDYLVCHKDEYNPLVECGKHRMGDIEKTIPLNYILNIKKT